MLLAPDETRYFDSRKAELLREHPGRFALVWGHDLVGVYDSVEDALWAAGDAFEAGRLPVGARILISEIAQTARVRVVAHPARLSARPT